MANPIKIGISSCLLGEQVRFDSGHKKNACILNVLGPHFEFVPFCPEVSIGLGIPRETIRLVMRDDQVRCVGNKTPDLDVTEKLIDCGERRKKIHQALSGYILKKDSPSCGMERVKLYTGDMPERKGVGLFAATLMKNFPYLPVEEEGRLNDPVLRENFIQRVFIYARWQALVDGDFSWKALCEFHAQHKYIYLSHNQNDAKTLGKWLAENNQLELGSLQEAYLSKMMALLKQRASRKRHTNTLQHIQGYLKKHICADDKQELAECIQQYNQGLLPLIVPMTLLKHHFRKYPHPYITDTYYMAPHPSELMLLNSL
jgi:uncharacterized protein YbgA (DUF1722 family)/uncharacterized protein YbbK (DUF523 family)